MNMGEHVAEKILDNIMDTFADGGNKQKSAIWLIFEWLDYHFVTITCFALVIGMIIQFVWTNASGMLNRSTSEVPRFVLPEDLFVNLAVAIGSQINQFFSFIQDVACGRNLKQFIMVVAGLWVAAVIGSCCNFLTVIYIGYIAAHTLLVLYERYEDQVDDFIYRLLGLARDQYKKLDEGVLSRIPKASRVKYKYTYILGHTSAF